MNLWICQSALSFGIAKTAVCGELDCLSFAGTRTQSSWASDISNGGSWIIGSIEDQWSINTAGHLRWGEPKETQTRGGVPAHLWWSEMPLSGSMPPQSWRALGILGHFVIHGDNRNARIWIFSHPNFERNKVQMLSNSPKNWGTWHYHFSLLYDIRMLGDTAGAKITEHELKNWRACFSQLSHRCGG